jgi:8-oxo-dGTP pyrophosphatase MutT (NUDIX family)
MTFPCFDAVRYFDYNRHRPFWIGPAQAGWLREADARMLLRRWPGLFVERAAGVAIDDGLADCDSRSAALAPVIRVLAGEGHITGWRDETYAVHATMDAPPLALIERAASRLFGTTTFAVHVNGVVRGPEGLRLWIARRSPSKATDPGMLDTLVGGGVGWPLSLAETLVKECREESGIPEALARQARAAHAYFVLREIEQGTQAEWLHVYDLTLPADFQPVAEDGEVSEHRLLTPAQALQAIERGAMTVDASVATLDCLARHALVAPTLGTRLDALRRADLPPPAALRTTR